MRYSWSKLEYTSAHLARWRSVVRVDCPGAPVRHAGWIRCPDHLQTPCQLASTLCAMARCAIGLLCRLFSTPRLKHSSAGQAAVPAASTTLHGTICRSIPSFARPATALTGVRSGGIRHFPMIGGQKAEWTCEMSRKARPAYPKELTGQKNAAGGRGKYLLLKTAGSWVLHVQAVCPTARHGRVATRTFTSLLITT